MLRIFQNKITIIWSTSKELLTFFCRVPEYDVSQLLKLEYEVFGECLGKGRERRDSVGGC